MKNSAESFQQHKQNQNIQNLARKAAELRERSRRLSEQLSATLKQSDKLLHPERTQNHNDDDAK